MFWNSETLGTTDPPLPLLYRRIGVLKVILWPFEGRRSPSGREQIEGGTKTDVRNGVLAGSRDDELVDGRH